MTEYSRLWDVSACVCVCVCVVKVIGRLPCTRRIIHDHLHLERQMAGRSQRHLTEGEGVVGSDQRGRWGWFFWTCRSFISVECFPSLVVFAVKVGDQSVIRSAEKQIWSLCRCKTSRGMNPDTMQEERLSLRWLYSACSEVQFLYKSMEAVTLSPHRLRSLWAGASLRQSFRLIEFSEIYHQKKQEIFSVALQQLIT